jgi:hypothetical protein
VEKGEQIPHGKHLKRNRNPTGYTVRKATILGKREWRKDGWNPYGTRDWRKIR